MYGCYLVEEFGFDELQVWLCQFGVDYYVYCCVDDEYDEVEIQVQCVDVFVVG